MLALVGGLPVESGQIVASSNKVTLNSSYCWEYTEIGLGNCQFSDDRSLIKKRCVAYVVKSEIEGARKLPKLEVPLATLQTSTNIHDARVCQLVLSVWHSWGLVAAASAVHVLKSSFWKESVGLAVYRYRTLDTVFQSNLPQLRCSQLPNPDT